MKFGKSKKNVKYSFLSNDKFRMIYNNVLHFLKNLDWKKIFKCFFVFSVISICFYVFMKFTLLITVDGSKYYTYLDYFRGEKNIGQWDQVRGFSFPLILFLITSIFGDNIRGVLIGFFLFYLGLIYFSAKIVKELIKDNNLNKRQLVYWGIFCSLFLFNPLIIGYGHTLLTEAVTPFFYMIFVYLCLCWNNYSFKTNKKNFVLISVLLIIISVFVWFIKQPYAPAVWISMILTAVLSGVFHKKIRYFVEKIVVFILCIITTFVSIFTWDWYLTVNGKENVPATSNVGFLSSSLIGYTYHYRYINKDIVCDLEFIEDVPISKKERKKIYKLIDKKDDWCDYLRFYNVLNRQGEWIETEVIIQESKQISLGESFSFMIESLSEHPDLVFNSYFENYLSIINLQETFIDHNYISEGKIVANVAHENVGIGYIVFNEGYKNCWWLWQDISELTPDLQELTKGMEHYESTTNTNSSLSAIMQILQDGSELSFKLLLLFCFPLFIYGFVMLLKRSDNKSYFMICLLSGVSFGHIMFHVLMGAIIDRYCYPIYPLMLLCLVILLMDKTKKYKLMDGSEDEK